MKIFGLCQSLLLTVGCQSVAPSGIQNADDSQKSKIQNISTTNATVWMPLAWSPKVAAEPEAKSSLESLQLKDVKILIKNLQNNAQHYVPLQLNNVFGQNSVLIDKQTERKTFFIDKTFELPEGNYVLDSVQAIVVQNGSTQPVVIQIPNPFGKSQPSIQLIARKGRVSVLSRLAMQTVFGSQGALLTSTSTLESMDREVLPGDLILSSYGNKVTSVDLFAGNPEFPRLRFALSSFNPVLPSTSAPSEKPEGRLGIVFNVPCALNGTLKLVWKKMGGDREYAAMVPMGTPESTCNQSKLIAANLLLPKGDWLLKSTHIVAANETWPSFKSEILKSANQTEKSYFSLDQLDQSLLDISAERDVQRQFVVRMETGNPKVKSAWSPASTPAELTNSVLYLGQFDLSAPKGKPIETTFRRNFVLKDLQKVLGAKDIYSAYSLAKITADRAKGSVQTILRVTSAETDAVTLKDATNEFRGKATDSLRRCVIAREETDPLATVSGKLSFTVLKGTNSINIKLLASDATDESQKSIQDCFEKKLFGMRFAKRVPANFQGELKFVSE